MSALPASIRQSVLGAVLFVTPINAGAAEPAAHENLGRLVGTFFSTVPQTYYGPIGRSLLKPLASPLKIRATLGASDAQPPALSTELTAIEEIKTRAATGSLTMKEAQRLISISVAVRPLLLVGPARRLSHEVEDETRLFLSAKVQRERAEAMARGLESDGSISAEPEPQEQPITYRQLLEAAPVPFCYLNKGDALIKNLPLDDSLKNKLLAASPSREKWHLARLLRLEASKTEWSFALAYLSNIEELEKRLFGAPAGYTVLSEGLNATMWWTLSPYIFKHLKKRGWSDRRALDKLLDWAEEALQIIKTGGWRDEYDRLTLTGIDKEQFNSHKRAYILDLTDPDHITHRYADQEAKRIVALPFFSKPGI